jgi:hypothetical protein
MTKSLAAGLIIGAALAIYVTHRRRAASHDPAHPHLPPVPPPEERRERVQRGAERLRDLRERQAA